MYLNLYVIHTYTLLICIDPVSKYSILTVTMYYTNKKTLVKITIQYFFL